MKKLLIILLFFSACSITDLSPESQKWIASVYNQGWYWPLKDNQDKPSGHLVPFQSDGSFVGEFTPWTDKSGNSRLDMPIQYNTKYILDEVNEDSTHAYYRFTYRFNGENLTLYQGVFHGYLNTTKEPGIFWASLINRIDPPDPGNNADIRAWLLGTYAKDNFGTEGSSLGLKKSSRSTTVENNTPNDSNAPTSDNTSGTMKN